MSETAGNPLDSIKKKSTVMFDEISRGGSCCRYACVRCVDLRNPCICRLDNVDDVEVD